MKKILLLEDDKIQAKNLLKMIQNYSQNIETFYAATFRQAINFLNSAVHFDAFFLETAPVNAKIPTDSCSFYYCLSPAYIFCP